RCNLRNRRRSARDNLLSAELSSKPVSSAEGVAVRVAAAPDGSLRLDAAGDGLAGLRDLSGLAAVAGAVVVGAVVCGWSTRSFASFAAPAVATRVVAEGDDTSPVTDLLRRGRRARTFALAGRVLGAISPRASR